MEREELERELAASRQELARMQAAAEEGRRRYEELLEKYRETDSLFVCLSKENARKELIIQRYQASSRSISPETRSPPSPLLQHANSLEELEEVVLPSRALPLRPSPPQFS